MSMFPSRRQPKSSLLAEFDEEVAHQLIARAPEPQRAWTVPADGMPNATAGEPAYAGGMSPENASPVVAPPFAAAPDGAPVEADAPVSTPKPRPGGADDIAAAIQAITSPDRGAAGGHGANTPPRADRARVTAPSPRQPGNPRWRASASSGSRTVPAGRARKTLSIVAAAMLAVMAVGGAWLARGGPTPAERAPLAVRVPMPSAAPSVPVPAVPAPPASAVDLAASSTRVSPKPGTVAASPRASAPATHRRPVFKPVTRPGRRTPGARVELPRGSPASIPHPARDRQPVAPRASPGAELAGTAPAAPPSDDFKPARKTHDTQLPTSKQADRRAAVDAIRALQMR